MLPNNTSDISSSLLQEIIMASKQKINLLHQICAFLQYFAAFCSIRNKTLCWYFLEILQTSQLTVIRWFYWAQCWKFTICYHFLYFCSICSILQYFTAFKKKPWGINGDSENIHTKDTIPTQKPLLAITSAAQTLVSLLDLNHIASKIEGKTDERKDRRTNWITRGAKSYLQANTEQCQRKTRRKKVLAIKFMIS